MKITLVLVGALVALMAVGCKKGDSSLRAEDVTTNTIIVKKDDTVQSSFVEEFDKEYYSKEELEEFIDQEVKEYNDQNGEEQVKMSSIHVADKKASVVFYYHDIEDYANFNGIDTRIFTIEQAGQDSDFLAAEFINAKTEDSVAKDVVLQEEEAQVLLLQEPVVIKVEGTVLYYSNVKKIAKNEWQADGENLAVVVYKKK
ncbi:hypothetical protein [Anaerosporobacter faecicola]|uniref:hypothetical protein n=1 Tax=Anaerosporobacter faecicola TaxID=2718714 RepID=UPI001439D4F7|nr:hypothetical protein [Anaerosporobacter faecicola]